MTQSTRPHVRPLAAALEPSEITRSWWRGPSGVSGRAWSLVASDRPVIGGDVGAKSSRQWGSAGADIPADPRRAKTRRCLRSICWKQCQLDYGIRGLKILR
jgi:hypothetical protein